MPHVAPPAAPPPTRGGWLAALTDLLLPVACAGCEAVGVAWCARCRAAFGRAGRLALPGLAPVLALAPYAGPARETVLAYKERGRRDLAAPLAEVVRAALVAYEVPAAAVVPAPSRPAAARARGGDHVLRLASALVGGAANAPGGRRPVLVRALALGAGARDSVGLDAPARAANLARHLRLRPRGLAAAAGLPVLLLDDVLTTGSTARAASALLRAAGRPPVAVVVLTAVRTGAGPGPPADPDGGVTPRAHHPVGPADTA